MSIVDFIAVVSFGLTCFGLGYTFGKDNNKPQKLPLSLPDQGGYFCGLLLSLPKVYPRPKQVKPKLTTAIKSTILMA